MRCAILGAGSWGTALAEVLAHNGHIPLLWSLSKEDVLAIKHKRENPSYLPWIILHKAIFASNSLQEILENVSIIILAIPSQALASCLKEIQPYYKGQTLVLATKWRNALDFSPLSSLIKKELNNPPLVVLSGASHAEEVVQKIPTGVIFASEDQKLAYEVRWYFENQRFKGSINTDLIGVQLFGAFKNVVALACGISDGLHYWVNTKALLLTQGCIEITQLSKILGAKTETLNSFAGIGDLYVTCSSSLSRNRNAGCLLAQGYTKEEIGWKLMIMVAEGLKMIPTIQSFLQYTTTPFPLLKMIVEISENPSEAQNIFNRFLQSDF